MAKKAAAPRRAPAPGADVDAFVATVTHPHVDAIQALRRIFLSADRAISEGVKWNAPSFRTTEWFATLHLRTKPGIGVVMHLGAKVRATGPAGIGIDDPEGLLTWLAMDRAMVAFADVADVEAKRAAFTAVIRQWIVHV